MSNGCVLGISYNKPIRVLSPIPFKSHLGSRHGGFTIYTAEFASTKTEVVSREETDLLVHEQIGSLNLFFFLCVLHFLLTGQ